MPTLTRFRGLAVVAYALGAAVLFDGPMLLLALGIGTAAFALTAQPRPSTEAPRYRLEHRSPGRGRILAATNDEGTGHETLYLQAAELTAAGVTGQLVLVDLATGRSIDWQVLGLRNTDGTADDRDQAANPVIAAKRSR